MRLPKKYLSNIPLMALIAANVIPLFGAIFWGWRAFNIIFLYWAENFVVGFYTILKMASVRCRRNQLFGKIFVIFFFTIHYGLFTAGHGFFIFFLFGVSEVIRLEGADPMLFWKEAATSVMSPHMMGALLALFLSHGVSFVRNYLLKGELTAAHFWDPCFSVYRRVLVMHAAIIAGSFPTMILGSPLGLLVVLIVLKTAIDARSHLREHKKAKAHALELVESHVSNKEVLVAVSKVKAYIKSKNMRTSSDAIPALSDKVRAILDKAVARAKANHRSTVKPHDL
jgi:hypothetical protein